MVLHHCEKYLSLRFDDNMNFEVKGFKLLFCTYEAYSMFGGNNDCKSTSPGVDGIYIIFTTK